MVKNAVQLVILAVSAVSASGLRVAGSDPGLRRPILDSRSQIGDCRLGQEVREDTTVIAYDDGTHRTWWCSDKDSFGAAVRFTPASYPCYIVGARAEVGYDGGQQVYLRVFDDDGAGGLPGTLLYEQQRLDIPQGQNVGFRDYDLTAAVTIDSGDFYISFWQKHWFHLLFGTDTQFDSIPREWWFFPDQGWVTPTGMDAADHLIRARVLYSTGVEDDLAANQVPGKNEPVATVVRGVLFLPERTSAGTSCLLDVSGRPVMDLEPGANDVRALAPGVYFARPQGPRGPGFQDSRVTKVVVTK